MKPLLPAALAAVATAAALGTSAHGASKPDSLKLIATDKGFTFDDLDPQGIEKHASLGDTIYLSGAIGGDAEGRFGLSCFVSKPGSKTAQDVCAGDFALKGGDLFVQARIPFSGPGKLAITGGTGAYAGASGTGRSRGAGRNKTAIDLSLES